MVKQSVHIVLSDYGTEFLSLLNFKEVSQSLLSESKGSSNLCIDLKGVNLISPSFMTKLIRGLAENGCNSIKIENASKKLETTFNFAKYTLNRSGFRL